MNHYYNLESAATELETDVLFLEMVLQTFGHPTILISENTVSEIKNFLNDLEGY